MAYQKQSIIFGHWLIQTSRIGLSSTFHIRHKYYMPNIHSGISVVLPNFNGRKLLEENLPSLFAALDKADCDYEVIVADDASSDDSIEYLRQNHPEIRIKSAEQNQGFSGNCNSGAKIATKDLLCIANTDATFDINYFLGACTTFANNKHLFALKGDIHNYRDEKDKPYYIGKVCQLYSKRGLLRFNHNVIPDSSKFGPNREQQFPPLGTGFICDRKKYLELGGFDEVFSPYYWEDSDLPLRALRKGWQIHYTPERKLYHKTSSTISKTQSNVKRRLVSIRNKHLFAWRHLKGKTQWVTHVFYVFTSLLTRWIVFDWKYYVALLWAIWRHFTYNHQSTVLGDIK